MASDGDGGREDLGYATSRGTWSIESSAVFVLDYLDQIVGRVLAFISFLFPPIT